MDHTKLPPGVMPAPHAPLTVAIGRLSGNEISFDDPIMSGIQVQVQHPRVNETDRPTAEPGLLAGTVVATPVGPLVCIQVRHHDGTSLTAMLDINELADWAEIFDELLSRVRSFVAQPEGNG